MLRAIKENEFIIIICLISTVARFSLDSYLPSLPNVQAYFAVAPDIAQLSITLYLFGFGVSQLFYGPLSDCFGRKKILIDGFIIFLIGTSFAALATSINVLLVGRFLAGAGCGAAGVINRAIARDCYSGAEFAKVWSHTATAIVITLIVAPLLGAYIQDYLGWRANLVMGLLYVLFVIVIIVKLLPETNQSLNKNSIKIRYIFATYKMILTHRPFLGAALCYTLAFAGLTIYFQLSPFLLIEELDISVKTYGYLSLAIAFSYYLGGFLVRKFVPKLGINKMLKIGIILLCISGGVMLAGVILPMCVWLVTLPTIIYVLGARIVIPNAIAGCLEQFGDQAGFASGLIGAIQMLGSALVSIIMSQFNTDSQLPLALCFIVLGTLCLIVYNKLFFAA